MIGGRAGRRTFAAGALAAVFAVAGCVTAPPPPSACVAPGQPAVLAELLFGLSRPGGAVAPGDFDAFVSAEIAPRFPAGLTVLPGEGGWRAPEGGRIAEASRMVVIAAPDTPDTAARLHAIRAAYRARFMQRSVGLITIQSCASF